jgi:hypothetical protein
MVLYHGSNDPDLVSEHGYSAFFISSYAPGDEYVIVDGDYLPIPVTKG